MQPSFIEFIPSNNVTSQSKVIILWLTEKSFEAWRP